MSRWRIATLFVLLLGGVGLYHHFSKPSPSREGRHPGDDKPENQETPRRASTQEQFASELVGAGWEERAAMAVAGLLDEWMITLQREHPSHAAVQRAYLRGLGKHASLMPLLEQQPELAGLLAGAHDPLLIARTVPSNGGD